MLKRFLFFSQVIVSSSTEAEPPKKIPTMASLNTNSPSLFNGPKKIFEENECNKPKEQIFGVE